jgi:hypothetical protein
MGRGAYHSSVNGCCKLHRQRCTGRHSRRKGPCTAYIFSIMIEC